MQKLKAVHFTEVSKVEMRNVKGGSQGMYGYVGAPGCPNSLPGDSNPNVGNAIETDTRYGAGGVDP